MTEVAVRGPYRATTVVRLAARKLAAELVSSELYTIPADKIIGREPVGGRLTSDND